MIQVVDSTNRDSTIEVPGDRPVGQILPKLVAMLDLPQQPGGRFVFHHKKSGRDLDESKSLEDQGVANHDMLRLRIEAIPGARGGRP